MGASLFPFVALAFGAPLPVTGLAAFSCGLILIKHIPNFKRLMGWGNPWKGTRERDRSHLENSEKIK